MQYTKILCVNCPQYKVCSQKTRMFINYCGSRSKNIKSKIAAAFEECRQKQGLIFKNRLFNRRTKIPKVA